MSIRETNNVNLKGVGQQNNTRGTELSGITAFLSDVNVTVGL